MNPILLKVPYGPSQSFSVRQDSSPYFYNKWHYHYELELTLIQKGSGTRFIGDSIERFEPGDLILVGSDLPHLWQSDQKYFEKGNKEMCEALVVHFTPDFAGKEFIQLPELAPLQILFEKSGRGLRILGNTRALITKHLKELYALQGLDRFLLLIKMLQLISQSRETEPISGLAFSNTVNEADTNRLNDIYAFTLGNFAKPIKLEEIASVAHLSVGAFCRYFKSHTHKTYIKFLQEVRVSHACKLLLEDKLSISQICLECGFQDLSNFNRYFKEIKKQTPKQYLKQRRGFA